jgi:hypothetical protein
VAKRVFWLAIFTPTILTGNATCHYVPRGSFAIPFANSVYRPMSAFEGKRTSHMRERSTTGILRIVIAIAAGFLIWEFSDGFLLAWETLAEPTEARWFNVLSALGEGLLAPMLAVSAIALSATNQRPFLAGILVILAAVIYAAPFVAFFIGIMIYGF